MAMTYPLMLLLSGAPAGATSVAGEADWGAASRASGSATAVASARIVRGERIALSAPALDRDPGWQITRSRKGAGRAPRRLIEFH